MAIDRLGAIAQYHMHAACYGESPFKSLYDFCESGLTLTCPLCLEWV